MFSQYYNAPLFVSGKTEGDKRGYFQKVLYSFILLLHFYHQRLYNVQFSEFRDVVLTLFCMFIKYFKLFRNVYMKSLSYCCFYKGRDGDCLANITLREPREATDYVVVKDLSLQCGADKAVT